MLEDQQSATGKLRAFAFEMIRHDAGEFKRSKASRTSVRTFTADLVDIVRTSDRTPHSAEFPIPGSRPNEAIEQFTLKVVRFKVPPELFDQLIPELQDGRRIALHPVVFAQGINEFQTYQNTLGTNALQKELNQQSLAALHSYYRSWDQCMSQFAGRLEYGIAMATGGNASGGDNASSMSFFSVREPTKKPCVESDRPTSVNEQNSSIQVSVVCPPGISAGQQVSFKIESGTTFVATVPEGVGPGGTFVVKIRKPAASAKTSTDSQQDEPSPLAGGLVAESALEAKNPLAGQPEDAVAENKCETTEALTRNEVVSEPQLADTDARDASIGTNAVGEDALINSEPTTENDAPTSAQDGPDLPSTEPKDNSDAVESPLPAAGHGSAAAGAPDPEKPASVAKDTAEMFCESLRASGDQQAVVHQLSISVQTLLKKVCQCTQQVINVFSCVLKADASVCLFMVPLSGVHSFSGTYSVCAR